MLDGTGGWRRVMNQRWFQASLSNTCFPSSNFSLNCPDPNFRDHEVFSWNEEASMIARAGTWDLTVQHSHGVSTVDKPYHSGISPKPWNSQCPWRWNGNADTFLAELGTLNEVTLRQNLVQNNAEPSVWAHPLPLFAPLEFRPCPYTFSEGISTIHVILCSLAPFPYSPACIFH